MSRLSLKSKISTNPALITKTVLILFLSFASIQSIFSAEVDTLRALQTGKNFILPQLSASKAMKFALTEEIGFNLVYTATSEGKPLYYVFNFSPAKGFIILSANDIVQPVLGYSFENDFEVNDTKPDGFISLLNDLSIQIETLINENAEALPEIKAAWETYSKEQFTAAKGASILTSYSSIAPLLKTTWNQGCSYNAICPVDAAGPCGRTWAGCVAVSEAQVLKYWNYPDYGEGSRSYNHYKYGAQSADFGTTNYNWASMSLTSANSEVAKLLYHVGVSVDMNYGVTGSGAYMMATENSVEKYFKYTTNSAFTCKGSYRGTNWENLIKRELDEGRPVMFSGGTHAFVVDGYQTGDFFHVNWGWGGSYDGNFYLTALKPGSYDFTSGQCALVGVMPKTLDPGIDISGIKDVSCGTIYNDSTTDGENRVNKFGTFYNLTTGKEKFYSVTTTMTGRLKAKITGLKGMKLNIFILNHPDRDSLLAFGDSVVYIDNAAPGKYYIAVDGQYGEEGSYSLQVLCPTTKPDFVITDNQINPYYIEPNQSNVKLKCELKNIGNSTSAASKFRFYYSLDNILGPGDIKIDSVAIPAIAAKGTYSISKNVTMPAITVGNRYILFVADATNLVNETDETDNVAFSYFQAVPFGIMDCSSAVELESGKWYFGNTALHGDSLISSYLHSQPMTGKEIIHFAYAPHDGKATIRFSETLMGQLTCFVLTACNENLVSNQLTVWSKTDTMYSLDYYVNKNNIYYFVVDGKAGLSGAYALQINMPDSCPSPVIFTSGDTNRCVGSGSVYLNSYYNYSSYQWYNNGFPVLNETNSYCQVSEDGNYSVRVKENNCTATSNTIGVKYSPKPINTAIKAYGDTVFCSGGSVPISFVTTGSYGYKWTLNDKDISGATGTTYAAVKTGTYRAKITNSSCTVLSNKVQVLAKPQARNIGDTLLLPSDKLVTWYPFSGADDYLDMSGNANNNSAVNCYLTKDKQGNSNQATYFDGLESYMTSNKKFNHPDTITISLWVKTNTTKGGKLIGLGNEPYNKLSTQYDRHIYMDNAGKILFGVNNGGAKVVTSALAYNDNTWHLVTATLSDKGMKLYMDSSLVDSRLTPTSGEPFAGYWHIGWDNMSGWPSKPDSAHFKGAIDEVRIYKRELSKSEIAILFTSKVVSTYALPDAICASSGTSRIYIKNSELGIGYQLRKNSNNSTVGTEKMGTGGSIYLETNTLTTTTDFNILARNTANGCSYTLDTVITIPVNTTFTPAVTLTTNAPGDSICQGQKLLFTAHPLHEGSSPSYQWKVNGANVTNNLATYSTTSLQNNDSVRVLLSSSKSCITKLVVSSGRKTIKTTETVVPSISIASDAALDASCKGTLVTLIASQTNGGNHPTYLWRLNGMQVGSDSASFETNTLNDKDKIYATVFSNKYCATPDSALSNTITFDVTDVSKSSILLVGSDRLKASVTAETYEWYKDGVSISMDNQQIKPLLSGMYRVVGIQNNCRSELSDGFNFTQTSSKTLQQPDEISLYPNPTTGLIYLDFGNMVDVLSVDIVTTSGQLISTYRTEGETTGQLALNLTGKPDGVYILRIVGSNGIKTMKIVLTD